MKSKENFPESSYGQQLISCGAIYLSSFLERRSLNNIDEEALESLNQAIKYHRRALTYKESENNARLALGNALICRYHTTFLRTDLDKAIENLLVVKAPTPSSALCFTVNATLGGALFTRYLLDKRVEDLFDAKNRLEKVLSIINQNANNNNLPLRDEVLMNLGKIYLNCFYYSRKEEDLQEAISSLKELYTKYKEGFNKYGERYRFLLKKSGDLDLVFYDYGVCIYERWKKEKNPDDLREAINILNEYLTIKEKDFKAYITLRGAFYSNNSKVEGNECIRTALYLLLTQSVIQEPRYENIINKIPTDDLYDSLKYIQFNLPDRGLKESDVEKFFREKDFLVLLQYLHLKEQDKEVLRSKPILLFYLGGIVSSYIIFDEKRNTKGEDSAMTPQEYYYYSRSALSFYDHNKTLIRADSIISSAIQNILKQKPSSNEDCYYLGQLYYLKWLKTEEEDQKDSILSSAKKWFEKCENSIWAKAMLAGISEEVLPEDVSNYIKNNCDKSQNISTAEEKESFLNQFKDYFHLHELLFAYPDLLQEIGGDLKFFEPIWKVFHLSPSDYEYVALAIRKATGEALQKEKATLLAAEKSKRITTDTNGMNEELWRFPSNQNTKWVEKMAQELIKNNTFSQQDNAILLRILLNEHRIDEDQFYALFRFNEFCAKQKKERDTLKGVDDFMTFSSILLSLINFNGLSIGIDLLAFLLKFINIEADNYEDFKRNLWIIMNNESTDESYFSV